MTITVGDLERGDIISLRFGFDRFDWLVIAIDGDLALLKKVGGSLEIAVDDAGIQDRRAVRKGKQKPSLAERVRRWLPGNRRREPVEVGR